MDEANQEIRLDNLEEGANENVANDQEGLLENNVNEGQEDQNNRRPPQNEEEDEEIDVEEHASSVLTILKPVALTMLIVIWAVKMISLPGQNQVG